MCKPMSYSHVNWWLCPLQPLAPPPDGKVYGRCAFCKCLIIYSPTAKALVCPRESWCVSVCWVFPLLLSISNVYTCLLMLYIHFSVHFYTLNFTARNYSLPLQQVGTWWGEYLVKCVVMWCVLLGIPTTLWRLNYTCAPSVEKLM